MFRRRRPTTLRVRRSFARAILGLALALSLFAPGRASADERVRLYTIGPGSYLFSLFGHSVVCVGDRCFDYGVPTHADAVGLVWHALRGTPDFAPIEVTRKEVEDAFAGEGRKVEVQEIPFDDAHRASLLTRLTDEVRTRAAYAYNPWYDNCTTHPRDLLDEAAGGALKRIAAVGTPRSFRAISELGFSGRILPLAAMAIGVGGGNAIATAYERMGVPDVLRDGVTQALGAPPVLLRERQSVELPTSPHAGRVAMLVLGVAFAFAIFRTRARPLPARRGVLQAITALFALLGVVIVALALSARFPEVSRNWNLLVFLPFDAALPWLSETRARAYLLARLGILVALALLSAASIVAQPLVVTSLFVAIPLAVLYRYPLAARAR